MDLRSDDDMKGIVEEMAEDRGRILNRRNSTRRRSSGTHRPGWMRTLFFGGIAVLILAAALVLLTGGEESKEAGEWQILADRLNAIEERMDRMEASIKQVPALTGRIEGLAKSLGQMEADRTALKKQIEQLTHRMQAPVPSPASDRAAAPASSGTQARHTVQKGETLFSIARLYGMSVDQLCRLNEIKKTAVIQPGQTLIVKGDR